MSPEVFRIVFPLWLKAFSLTLAVEVPVFFAVARLDKSSAGRLSLPRLLAAAAAGTCLTHPLFWFVWPRVVHDYVAYMVSGELLVAFVETVTFYLLARPLRFRYALLASFGANALSCGVGAVLQLLS